MLEAQIEEHGVHDLTLEDLEGTAACLVRADPKAVMLEADLQELAQVFLVIDDDDVGT
jgi:hypothetical protein